MLGVNGLLHLGYTPIPRARSSVWTEYSASNRAVGGSNPSVPVSSELFFTKTLLLCSPKATQISVRFIYDVVYYTDT